MDDPHGEPTDESDGLTDGSDRRADGTDDDPETDPTRIRSIAVHRGDVANALEATLRTDRRVVIRVTPPYSGRMRARIHRPGGVEGDAVGSDDGDADGGDDPESVHIDPRDLVDGIPSYPEVDDTATEHPDSDVETLRSQHADAVESWREQVRESIAETIEIPVGDRDIGVDGGSDGTDGPNSTTDGPNSTTEIDVVALG